MSPLFGSGAILTILANGKFRQIINSKCPHNSENGNYKHHSNYLMTVCELYFFIWAAFCQHVAVLYILVIQVHGNQCRDPMNNDKDSDLDSTLRVWNNYWARILFEHWIQAKLSRQSQLKNTRLFKNGTVIINDTSKTNEWDIYCRKFWS